MCVSELNCISGHMDTRRLTVCAVKVGNTQNVRSTALRGAVESSAGGIGNLTVLNLNWGGEGHTGEDGSESKSELHGDSV